MATFNWKPLEEYSSFAQLLASWMWEQRPPLNPAQLASFTRIDYLIVYRWFNTNAKPDPSHLLRIAQVTPLSVQELFMAAGYGDADFPLFSLKELFDQYRQMLMDSHDIGMEERDISLRVWQQLRDAAIVMPQKVAQVDAEASHEVEAHFS